MNSKAFSVTSSSNEAKNTGRKCLDAPELPLYNAPAILTGDGT
jgi:hypothetical protein